MAKKAEDLMKVETIDEMLARYGLDKNEFVLGIKKRYIMQVTIINRLNEVIAKEGMTTEKKRDGCFALYSHPCVTELSKHISVANNTALTLTKVIDALGKIEEKKSETKEETNALKELLSD